MAIQDTVTIPKILGGSVSGPASYATGGFLLDLSASCSFLRFISIDITTRGNLECDDFEVILNQDTSGAFAQGKAVIKLLKYQYDKASIGNVSSLPAGVSAQSALFAAATTTGSSHTHTMDHGHVGPTQEPTAGGVGVATTVGGIAQSTHIHNVTIPDFNGNTGSNSHPHNRDFEYSHDHTVSTTQTTITPVEVSNGTNLSTTAWKYFAVGD